MSRIDLVLPGVGQMAEDRAVMEEGWEFVPPEMSEEMRPSVLEKR